MNNSKNQDYYIGIDAGSDSVGWAVTDKNYNLLRLKGKTAWGSRIFEGASDAKARRTYRTSGRRLNRRKYRTQLLNSIFAEEINKIDPTFFIRLSQSNLYLEDKDNNNRFLYPLFKEKEAEKDFYKKYPTIWHLRKAMANNDDDAFFDLRYVYLAIHHIIKYRGNFLKDDHLNFEKFDTTLFDKVNEILSIIKCDSEDINIEESDYEFIKCDNFDKFISIVEDKNLYKKNKVAQLKDLVSIGDKDSVISLYCEMFLSIVCGGTFSSTKIFPASDKIEIQFNSGFDDKESAIEDLFGEYYPIIDYAKQIFDYIYVKNILGKEIFISKAFSNIYEKHKSQLHDLKNICKTIDKEKNLNGEQSVYYKIFKNNDLDNYASFVHVNSKKKRCDVHSFNKMVLDTLNVYKELLSGRNDFEDIMKKAENDELLLTISNVSNSTIPHQLHLHELKLILRNAGARYPFLKDNANKIETLFMFRVPYYYGPLDSRSKYSNIVLKEKNTITPWNINEVIDDDATRKKFMMNLTNKCTYLYTENVLPAESIIYNEYNNLNRLNTLKINGVQINQHCKEKLYNEVILSSKKVTLKQLQNKLNYFVKEDKNDKEFVLTGLNNEDYFSSSSYVVMSKIFNLKDAKQLNEAEEIIFILTVYTDNKKDAIKVIKEKYKNLNNDQIKIILSLNCKGWAPFSKKLLTGISYTGSLDDNENLKDTILDILKKTNLNFNQIINNKEYDFLSLIKRENLLATGEMSNDDFVDSIIEQTPPLMHRTIIQTMKIIDEIKHITGKDPAKIAIEVTRNDQNDKTPTKSRKSELNNFLKSVFKGSDSHSNRAKDLSLELENKSILELKGKHLYLYFKQLGYDLYTGEKINIEDIFDGTKYDLDHIIPQSKIKDDSLDNLALVNRDINQKIKKDFYPLPNVILENKKVRDLWDYLYKIKAISSKKYTNLNRTTELSAQELNDFVNRQINVLDRSNIVVKEILEKKYKNTKIIFSKSQFPSFLRQELQLPKIRDLNDTHHAYDAYLNIVSGTILNEIFSKMIFINDEYEKHISYNMENVLLNRLKKNDLIQLIEKNYIRHDIILTYRNNYQDDALYKATIYPKEERNSLVPIHTNGPLSDTKKYGGYSNESSEYMLVAKLKNKKGKISKIIVTVPTRISKSNDNKVIMGYICNILGCNTKDLSVDLNKKIIPNQKILINKCEYLLCTNEKDKVSLKPATPIFLDYENLLYFKSLNRIDEKHKDYFDNSIEVFTDKNKTNKIVISKDHNLKLYITILKKAEDNRYDYCPMITDLKEYLIPDQLEEFSKKTIFDQCVALKELICLFGRNSAKSKFTSKNSFRKAKKSLFEVKVTKIDESVTGLYRKETEL